MYGVTPITPGSSAEEGLGTTPLSDPTLETDAMRAAAAYLAEIIDAMQTVESESEVEAQAQASAAAAAAAAAAEAAEAAEATGGLKIGAEEGAGAGAGAAGVKVASGEAEFRRIMAEAYHGTRRNIVEAQHARILAMLTHQHT